MERRSDDVSLMEEAEEDFVLVFPHINKNQNPPPSNQQGSTVSGRLSSLLVSMFKTPLGLAQIVTEPQRRPGQDLTDRVDQVSDLEVAAHILLLEPRSGYHQRGAST